MRKIYSIFLAATALAAVCWLGSCSDDKDSPVPPPGSLEDAFSYGDDVRQVASAIYTTKEQAGFTTFYLSPTANISDPEGMRRAGDYLKITVPAPSGEIDLTADGCEILYKDIAVTPATLGGYKRAELSVRLVSAKTVSIRLDVEAQSGQTLRSDYSGPCAVWPANNAGNVDYPCTDCVMSAYFGRGEGGDDVSNYYLVFTTQPFDIVTEGSSQYIQLIRPGYILYLDTYAPLASGEDKLTLTPGTYRSELTRAPFTYYSEYTAAVYQDESGSLMPYPLDGPVEIVFEEGVYTVSTSFRDDSGQSSSIAWKGPLRITDNDSPAPGGLPELDRDLHIEGTSAKAVYFGNLFASSTGFMNILIYDDTYVNEEGGGGLCASVAVFSRLFSNPREAHPVPGTYFVATDYRFGSWMPGIALDYMGIMLPMGCYIQQDDGSAYGSFSFGESGLVTISEAGEDSYKVEFDLTSRLGRRMTGSYTGTIPVTDESEDDVKDDGTSTLEMDHDMNLSLIKTARLWPLEDKESDEVGMCGWQDIDIGSPGEWDIEEVSVYGDIFRAELYVPQGTSGMITPGTYPIVEKNWPAYVKPGMAARGRFTTEADWSGTRWMHFLTGLDHLYLDGHAMGYGGEVKVEKAAGGDNWFTFTIDVTCVRGMHVRGTWTGPVINGFTNEPVRSTGTEAVSEAASIRPRAAAPTPAELRGAVREASRTLRGVSKRKF